MSPCDTRIGETDPLVPPQVWTGPLAQALAAGAERGLQGREGRLALSVEHHGLAVDHGFMDRSGGDGAYKRAVHLCPLRVRIVARPATR